MAGAAGQGGLPRFLEALPAGFRYRVLLYLGSLRQSRGDLEAARAAVERAVQVFPDRSEGRELLDNIRRRLPGTVVVSDLSDPLPLRRSEFNSEPNRRIRGTMTGNLWQIEEQVG